MTTRRPEFGNRALTDPSVTRQLAQWVAEDREQQIREHNDRLVTEHIRRWFERTDATPPRV